MFKRIVKLSKSNSFFLFGPRSTGKTTLLRQVFEDPDNLWVDLLNTHSEAMLRQNPENLEKIIDECKTKPKFVVVDEIQKIPPLLDVIHRLIFEKKIKFVLTGSSARKLKRGAANLLAGRAFRYDCFPLTHIELGNDFNLEHVLQFGSLPEIFSHSIDDKKEYLRAYIETYFKEEIAAEQIVRKLIPFKNFLEIASQSNTKILNMNNIAKSTGVDHTTIQNYFSVLEDTMVGYMLPPYHSSIRKRQRLKSKFYYFDLGVQRALRRYLDVPLKEGTYEYGDAFEHFIVLEFYRLTKYLKPDWSLSYLRTSDDAEIDLIVERPGQKTVLIKIKSTTSIRTLDQQKLIGFRGLAGSFSNAEAYIISQDPVELEDQGIHCIPWQKIFERIGLRIA